MLIKNGSWGFEGCHIPSSGSLDDKRAELARRSRCTSSAPSACPPPSRRARGRSRSASACAVASPPASAFNTMAVVNCLSIHTVTFRDFVCSNRWPMDRPKSRRFRPGAPPRRRQSRGAAAARDLDRQLLPTPRQQCGQLVGSQAGPRLCGSSHHHFLSRKLVGLAVPSISGWPTQCPPTVQSGSISRCNINVWNGQVWRTGRRRRQCVKAGAPTSF